MGYQETDRLLIDIEAKVRGQEHVAALSEMLARISNSVNPVAGAMTDNARAAALWATAERNIAQGVLATAQAEKIATEEVAKRHRVEEKEATARLKNVKDEEAAERKLEEAKAAAMAATIVRTDAFDRKRLTAMKLNADEAQRAINSERSGQEKLGNDIVAIYRRAYRELREQIREIESAQKQGRAEQEKRGTEIVAMYRRLDKELQAQLRAALKGVADQRKAEEQKAEETIAIIKRTERATQDQYDAEVKAARKAIDEIRLMRMQALADVKAGGSASAAQADLQDARNRLDFVPGTGVGNGTVDRLVAAEQIRVQNAMTSVTNAGEKQGMTVQRLFGYWWKFHAALIAVRLVQDGVREGFQAYIEILKPTEAIDRWTRQFTALTGSANTAQQALAAIRAEGLNSPFKTEEIAEAALKVQQFGASWKDVGPGIEAVAAVMHTDLSQATDRLIRVTTGGLKGVKGLTINMANVMEELGLAIKGSISGSDVQNWALFNQMIKDLQEKFPDAVAQMRQSIDGELMQMHNVWFEIRAEIGESGIGEVIRDDLKIALDSLRAAVADGSVRAFAQEMSDAMQGVAAMIVPVVRGFEAIGRHLREAKINSLETQLRQLRDLRDDPTKLNAYRHRASVNQAMGKSGGVTDAIDSLPSKATAADVDYAMVRIEKKLQALRNPKDMTAALFPDTGKDHSGDIFAPNDQRRLELFRQQLNLRAEAFHAHGEAEVAAYEKVGREMLAEMDTQGKKLPGAAEAVENAVYSAKMRAINYHGPKVREAHKKQGDDILADLRLLGKEELDQFTQQVAERLAAENAWGNKRAPAAKRITDQVMREMEASGGNYISGGLVNPRAMENAAARIISGQQVAGTKDLQRGDPFDPDRLKSQAQGLLQALEDPTSQFYASLREMRNNDIISQEEYFALEQEYTRTHLDEQLSYYGTYFARLGDVYGAGYHVIGAASSKFTAQLQKETERFLLHKKTSAAVQVAIGNSVVREAEAQALQELGIKMAALAKEDAVRAARAIKLSLWFRSQPDPFSQINASRLMGEGLAYGAQAVLEGGVAAVAFGGASSIRTREEQNQSNIDDDIEGKSDRKRRKGSTTSSTDRSLRTVGAVGPINNYWTIGISFAGGVFMGESTADMIVGKLAPAINRAIDNHVIDTQVA